MALKKEELKIRLKIMAPKDNLKKDGPLPKKDNPKKDGHPEWGDRRY